MMRTSPILFAMGLVTVALLGAMMGVQVGYTADSPDEAAVWFNGTHFAAGDNVSEVNTSAEPADTGGPYQDAAEDIVTPEDYYIDTPADPYIEAGVDSFVEITVKGAFHLAALTGSIGAFVAYRLQFLPLWAFTMPLQAAVLAPYALGGLAVLSRVREVTG